ncbi:hypothetical protein COY95_02565 [Candidatus Woesearchaeota archaeon CG_4_10_14_0_8_um_filter_47_5]|nr:MAG: hypothetical protein COY95_02565 [Candidatus Woesearchaeota archaeon CG_4_10_14_0_8_um_filter_47_5]
METPFAELFDTKKLQVLSLFLKEPDKQFYLREVSRNARVSPATTYRILRAFTSKNIIAETTISRFKVYQLVHSEKTDLFAKMLLSQEDPLQEFIRIITAELQSLEKIILFDQSKKNKASLLLIGENLSQKAVNAAVHDIKSRHNFLISFLTLSQEQYDQMAQLGIYGKSQKILFER